MATFGCDPELFFVNKEMKPISGHDIVPGTKRSPALYRSTMVQADGTAAEFNIPPQETAEGFVDHVLQSLSDINTLAAEHGLLISKECVSHYGKDYLNSLPMQAVNLGCDPDFNAYTNRKNPRPKVSTPFRTAAGHVHIGLYDNAPDHKASYRESISPLIKWCDVLLGIPSVIFDPNTTRRSLYGKAGAFRPKFYGAEYRVLSNAWLFDTSSIKWVFEQAKKACEMFQNNEELPISEEEIQNIINTSDVEQAKKIVSSLGIVLP